MFMGDWITALIGFAISYGLIFLLMRRFHQMRAKDGSGYVSDVKASSKLRAPFHVLYFVIIIPVDVGVMPPWPWYLIASAIFMIGLTVLLFRL